MLRSVLIVGIVVASLAFIILNPAIGILMWTWVSVMNPHRLTWGFAYDFPIADLIAGATLVGWLISKESKKIPFHPLVVLLGIYVVWTCITTVFAVYDEASLKWDTFMKIQLLVFLTLSIMKSRVRLEAFIWMNVLCIGYFALKGGAFTILTGGGHRVWGPPGSFIADNNQLGMAMVMTLPLVRYLHSQAKEKWMRWGLNGTTLLWLLGILGTQSRGAFVAVSCMLVYLWFRSKNKFITGVILVFAALAAVVIMPNSFRERMESIQNYEEDTSFMNRVVMWRFAMNVAADNPVLGGGFQVFYDNGMRSRYLEEGETGRAVHSVYFEVLGEHGYVGFAIFMLIGITAFFTCGRMISLTAKNPDLKWANDLGRMMQVALVGYAVNGLTLNLATFDLYYSLIAMIVLGRTLLAQQMAESGVIPRSRLKWSPRNMMPGTSADAPPSAPR